eukprot:20307-Alexandrium_andersonii.AAC.1
MAVATHAHHAHAPRTHHAASEAELFPQLKGPAIQYSDGQSCRRTAMMNNIALTNQVMHHCARTHMYTSTCAPMVCECAYN